MCSTDQAHHQDGGDTSSERTRVWWRMCSKDLSHHQYKEGTSSVRIWCAVRRKHTISTDAASSAEEAHHQYGHWCAVRMSHIISTDEGVQYRTTKTAQGVVGGRIYLGKHFIDNVTITQISFHCGCIQMLLRSLSHANMVTF